MVNYARRTWLLSILVLSLMVFAVFLGSCRKSKVSFVSRRASLSAAPDTYRAPFGLDAFLLIDQSGSMFGPKGTDPEGLRIGASRYFARNIAFKVARRSPHRVGVINFGTTAPKELMIPLTRANVDSIELVMSKLKVVNLHYTGFISALKAAHQGFVAKGSFMELRRKPAVIIFTDGRPDDPRHLALNQYFQEIEQYIDRKLKPNGCELFIVGIDITGKSWLRDKPRWERILPGHVYEIKAMGQLRERFNDIIRQIFYTPEVPPDTVTQRGLVFDVPPYLKNIEFHIFPEKEVILAIYRSNGEKVDTADADVRVKWYPHCEMVSIADPTPGKWRYEIEKGRGKVEVYRNPIPIKMELLRPLPTHPLGKQMEIKASFLRPDGREVKEYPQFPLRFTGTIIFPDGRDQAFKFIGEEDGIYQGDTEVDASFPGRYKIMLMVHAVGGFSSTGEADVDVKPMPYLVIDEPSQNEKFKYKNDLPVRVRLLYEGQPIWAEREFTDPFTTAIAQLVETPWGKSSNSIWLDPVKDSTWILQGILPVSLHHKGRYLLSAKLVGEARYGQKIPHTIDECGFFVHPTWKQKVSANWPWILGVFILIGIGILVYYKRLPVLTGQIWMRKGTGEPVSFFLSGHRVTIGGAGSDIILDPEAKKKLGYIVARLEETAKGYQESVPEIHYLLDPESKEYEIATLDDGTAVTIGEYTLEYRR